MSVMWMKAGLMEGETPPLSAGMKPGTEQQAQIGLWVLTAALDSLPEMPEKQSHFRVSTRPRK